MKKDFRVSQVRPSYTVKVSETLMAEIRKIADAEGKTYISTVHRAIREFIERKYSGQ